MASLDAILAKYTAAPGEDSKGKVLGATFVVLDKDGIIYNRSAGRIGHAPDSKPWKDDTFASVASMTKIVTATAVMQLVERGLLDLDADLRSLMPQLGQMPILKGFTEDEQPILEDHDTPLSMRMLLTHTLGLGYELADDDLMRWHKAVGRKVTNLEWSREGFTVPLKFKPGTGWFYGAALDWAGQVLERITGKTLGEYMAENIFEPLGMKDTGFWLERLPQVADRFAAWAYWAEDQQSLVPGPAMWAEKHPIESGGAGLYTTPADYSRFLHALLTDKLVKKDTLDEMFRPQLNDEIAQQLKEYAFRGNTAVEFEPDMELNYGLSGCINMRDTPGKRKKGSLTWSGMLNSHWWIDRESGIAAALFVYVLPFGDPTVVKLYDELERALYENIVGHV